MWIDPKHLKSFLLDSGLISKADIEAADAEAQTKRKTLEEILVSAGQIGEDDFRRFAFLRAFKIQNELAHNFRNGCPLLLGIEFGELDQVFVEGDIHLCFLHNAPPGAYHTPFIHRGQDKTMFLLEIPGDLSS